MTEVKNIDLGQPIEYGFLGIKKRLNIIKKYINLHNKYLLDIGCGNGAQTLEFLNYVSKCVAIDIEIKRLETFRYKLLKENIENCEIKQMDASSLQFPDKTFDVITCIETLEHVLNQKKSLSKMDRVLKNNGSLILSIPNKWWIFETHGANLPLLPWNRVPFFSWLPKKIHDRYAYARIYTRKEIADLVEKAGFRNIKIEFMMPPLDNLRNKFLQKILRRIIFPLEKSPLRIFGVSIFIFAKK